LADVVIVGKANVLANNENHEEMLARRKNGRAKARPYIRLPRERVHGQIAPAWGDDGQGPAVRGDRKFAEG
jgi:hypothetical protein